MAAFLGWMFDGMEMGIFPLVARPALLEFKAATPGATDAFVGYWFGIITALFLVGAAIGGAIFGWIGDKLGRIRAMSLSILCYSLFSALGYFAQEPWHLGAFRFMAALGMGGEWSLGVALVMEVWPEKQRPLMAGVIGAAANVGFGVIALVGLFWPVQADSWRWVMLVGAVPALLIFFIRLAVPESERWKEAVAKGPTRPLSEVFSMPLLPLSMMAIVFASVALIGTWGSVQWFPPWADELAGPGQPKAKAYTQLVSAIGAVLGCLLGAWMGGRFGRRSAYFILCLLSLASCQWLFWRENTYGTSFLVMVFLAGGITAAFYGWLPLYLPELFPTRVRATAQGVAFNSGRILAAFGALYMGDLMKQFNGSYAKAGAVITLVYVIGMIVIWFAPETKGKPLPE